MKKANATQGGYKGLFGRYRRYILAAFIGVLGILGAPREKAWANDIAYRETVPNTDFTRSAVGGMRNAEQALITLTGISGQINKAYLYWAGPMNSTNLAANANIRVNGTSVTGDNIGLSDDNCWGFDVSQTYRADITALVQSVRNGAYYLTGFVHFGTNINANGASLLVFFDDGNAANNRDIVLFDGNDSNAPNPYDAPGWNVVLPDVNYTSGRAFIETHVSDGQVYPDASIVLNGTTLQSAGDIYQGESVPSANDGPLQRGSLWDVRTWEITSLLTPGTNLLQLTHSYIGHDCISLVAAVINLPVGAAPPPPPVNHPPVLSGTPEITVNSTNAIPVTAQATDEDGDALTYRISVDNVEVQTGSVPAGEGVTTGLLSLTNSFSLGQHTVIFSVSDGKASASFTTRVTVLDDTPPVLNLPPNMTVPADLGKLTAVVQFVVTATDDFPGVVVVSLPASGSEFPLGVTTVTATAVDTSGNKTTGSFTITVTDSTPPSVQCPPNVVQATDSGTSNAVVHYTIPAADNMPGMSLTCTPPSGSVFPIGITAVVCLARDSTGNTATCMFMVTVVDQEPPVITGSTNIVTVSDLNQCSAVVQYEVSVRDNAPGATLVCEPPSGSTFPLGVTTVECIATDASMNRATNAFTVTVQDTQSPMISPLANLTVPTEPGKSTAVVQFQVSASDNCSAVNVLSTPPSGSVFPLGTTTVTSTATDAAGNMTTSSFNVTVVDREPPVLTVPNNLTVPTDPGRFSAVVNYVVTISDNVPGATVVVTPASGTTFPVGTTTVVAVGTDAAGNRVTNSFTVTVVDTEKPVLQLPADIIVTVPAGVNNAVVSYTVTATDNSQTVTVVVTPTSGSTFPLGSTQVTAQATDGAGNVATGSFTVTVVQEGNPDTQPPVLNVPPSIVHPADLAQCAAVVTFNVTAIDDGPGAVLVICTPPSGSVFPVGTTLVTCVATDAAGNKATNAFAVTVEDKENPALQLPATLVVGTEAGKSTATVQFNVTASDNCSSASVVCTPASGSVFALGTSPVNCTATDTAGNTAQGSFVVQVVDREPPVVIVPGNMIVPTDPGQGTAVVNFNVTIQDNVPGATLVVNPPSGSAFPLGTTTVVAVGTDAAGNQTTNTFTVTVVDQEKPVLNLPPDIVVVVPADATNAVVQYTVTATDNSGTVTVVVDPPSGGTFPLGTNTVTVTATDGSGNVTTGTFTVTVLPENPDDKPAVLNVPPTIVRPNDLGQCSAVVTFNVTAVDDLPGDVSIVCTPPSGSVFPVGATAVVCVATDAAGNKATAAFAVTVEDKENPVLQLPATLVVGTEAGKSTATAQFNVTANDNCSGAGVVCTPASGSVFALGTTPVNCTATDAAGNTAQGSFAVQVVDREPPVVTVPANMIVPTDPGQSTAVVNFNVTIQDNVTGATLVVNPPSGSAFPLGTTTVVAVGTDAAGNQTTNSFTITVVDQEKPVLNLPPDIIVVVPVDATNAVVQYTVTATDNSGTVTVVVDPPSGGTFPLGTNTVTVTATDGSGNVTTGTFTVTVLPENPNDDQPPVITTPGNLLRVADLGQCSAVVTFNVTVTDNLPGATVLCTPPSGSVFPVGTTTVVCIATDVGANKVTNSFLVTVEDKQNPTLQLPAPLVVGADAGQSTATVQFNVTASDNCSSASVVCTPASGSVFALGTTPVNCTATDGSDNVTTGTFTVTVVAENPNDDQPPVITTPGNLLRVADLGQCSAVVTFNVTVTDNLPGATVLCTPPSGSVFPVGTTTVVCVATDVGANKVTNSFLVTVEDKENPALQLPATLVVGTDAGQSTATVQFNVTASDNCSGASVVCTPASGSVFALGTTSVNCTATDTAGNTAQGSFAVQVVDREPPVVTVPANMIVPTDPGQSTAVVNFNVTIQDNVPGATLSVNPPSGSAFPLGTTTVVAVGTDAAGNQTTNSFTITVVDQEKPVLNLPPDIIVVVPVDATNAVVQYTVTATDNSGTVTVVVDPPSGGTFPLGTNTVTATATDGSGNVTTGTFTVTVLPENPNDDEPPVITTPGNLLRVADLGQCSAVVTFTVTVTDNLPGATVLCTPPSGSVFPVGTTTVVCVATDVGGNKVTNSFLVTVEDKQNPALQLPATLVVGTDAGQSTATVQFNVTASDNCSGASVVCTPASGSVFALGTTPVNCTATDTAGNTAQGSFAVQVVDREPPVVIVPGNMTVPTDPGQSTAVVNFSVTVQDNVPGATLFVNPTSGSAFPMGTTTVVAVGTDAAGNQTTNSFTITVVDQEKPVLNLPPDFVVVVPVDATNAVVQYTVTATDNSGTVTVVVDPVSGATFPLGTNTVTATATDGSGNVTTGTFTVTVLPENPNDDQPPIITTPGNLLRVADLGQCSAVVTFTVTAEDNLPGITIVCTPPSGSTFPRGATTVVCVATDVGGNKTTNTFTVTVVDQEKPALQLPGDVAVAVTAPQSSAAVNYLVTATDNCTTPVLVCNPPSGSIFPLGTTPVECSATDADNNTTTGSFQVVVSQLRGNDPGNPPVIDGATNRIVVSDVGQCSAVVSYSVTVEGNPNTTLLCTPASGSTFPKGVTPVVCVATDPSNHKAVTNSFTVTVLDQENPALQLPGDVAVTVIAPQASAVVNYLVTATDNCTTPLVVCNPPSGSIFPLGATPVQCSATDADNNTTTGSFRVVVSQLWGPPVINGATNRIVASDVGQCSAVVSYSVTVEGNPLTTLVCTPPSGSTFPKGVTPVVCVATDPSGPMSVTSSFTVTVLDQENPSLSLPGDLLVPIPATDSNAVVNFNASATDNCSVPAVVCSPASGSTFPLGVTTVTCVATDESGNTATGAFNVTVQRQPVVITVRPSRRILWPPNHKMVPIRILVKATDDSSKKVTSRIISVTSNQPEDDLGDGNTAPDWRITGDLRLYLRSERSGTLIDRIYTITVECTDAAGNVTLVTTEVFVPHDLSSKRALAVLYRHR